YANDVLVNLYDYITPKNGEAFTTLLEHKNIKINRIVSSDSIEHIEYIQEEDEWLVVVEGEATLLVKNEKILLSKGDTLFIPAKTPHKVLETKDGTVWLTVHIF
ncbi:MAG: cupin domain-containing protein, partial [Bacteroidales bacterium]|nr:cupin domain-containing protein [Bacteroidales bacterium]